jgi:hypothetical protein
MRKKTEEKIKGWIKKRLSEVILNYLNLEWVMHRNDVLLRKKKFQ